MTPNNTQQEMIVWHSAEEVDPPVGIDLLLNAQVAWFEDDVPKIVKFIHTGVYSEEGIYWQSNGLNPQLVIAWAEMPKGWKE